MLAPSTQLAIRNDADFGYRVTSIAKRYNVTEADVRQALGRPKYNTEGYKAALVGRELAHRWMEDAREIENKAERKRMIRVIAGNFLDVCPEFEIYFYQR